MTEKELFIGIWQVPPATEENYKMLVDCGINAIFLNGEYSEDIEEQKKAVGYSEKYGISVVLEGRNKLDGSVLFENPLKDSKAVKAFNLFDEPLYPHEQPLRELALKLKNAYPDKQAYINLYPSYVPCDEIMHDYPRYVETFAKWVYDIEGVGGWLSMDHYPLRRTKEDEFYLFDDWFTDIETTAVTAKKYGLKPHFFIQSMAFGGTISWWNDRTPTEEDIRLQIYAYLAYGAKGVSHFCYQSPKSNEFFERQSGLFDKGAPTERWFYAQKIHKELKPFEKELVNCSWEKCLRVDSTVADVNELFNCQNGNAFEEFATMQSVETTARCLVGAFKGTDGKESFMLVNVEDTSKKKTVAVTLTLKKPTSFKIYKSGENFVESFVNASAITLGVGEGIFMIEE